MLRSEISWGTQCLWGPLGVSAKLQGITGDSRAEVEGDVYLCMCCTIQYSTFSVRKDIPQRALYVAGASVCPQGGEVQHLQDAGSV